MSATDGTGDAEQQQQGRPERPSLPSIRSLFGITREDNLDTLLQIESSNPTDADAGPAREGRQSVTPPEGHRPTTQPPPSFPPSAYRPVSPAADEDSPSAVPGPARTRSTRRSSGASAHAGGSRSIAHALSDSSLSPLSQPDAPESASSSSPLEHRFSSGRVSPSTQGHASSSRAYAPYPLERPARQRSLDRSSDAYPSTSPRPYHESSTSPPGLSPAARRSTIAELTSPPTTFSDVPQPGEPGKRRYTVSDGNGTYTAEPGSSSSATASSSRPRSATLRRSLRTPYPTLPAPWSDAPDRQLPPLTGPTQSESQRRGSRILQPSQLVPLSFPSTGDSGRPASSPSPFTTHPPSSFPHRLSGASPVNPNPSPYGSTPLPLASSSSSALVQRTHEPLTSTRRPYTSESAYPSREEGGLHRPPPAPTTDSQKNSGSSSSSQGSAKYQCPHCQKRFNRPSSLKIHVNTHTGEKPFQCPYPGCGRRFSVMSNMRRHSRVHTQPRPTTTEAPAPIDLGDGDADAEGEPEPEGEAFEMEYMETPRARAPPAAGPSRSSPVSSRRGSTSSTRRSSLRGTSRAAASSAHVDSSPQAASSSRTTSRPVQPPLSPSAALLLPTQPQSLGTSAQILYEDTHNTPQPGRLTRSSSKRRATEPASEPRSRKRSKSEDGR